MSVFSDDFRDAIVELRDELTTDLVSGGLMFREEAVLMATATYASADPALGTPGTETIAYTEITPRPKFTRRDQWRSIGGVATKIGDAVAVVSRSITRAQLEDASWFAIGRSGVTLEDGGFIITEDGTYIVADGSDPERYTIVQGEIKQGPFDWTVVLRRENQ